MLSNCGVGEDSWQFLGQKINQVNPKSTLNIHWKDWCWSSNTLATWCKVPTLWERPWCWQRWKVGGEECGRGWDGWMASPTQWTWVWANSGRRCAVVHGVAMSRTQLSYWTTTMTKVKLSISGPQKQISLKRVNKYLKQLLTNSVIYSP